MTEATADKAIEKLSAARQFIAEATSIAALEPKRGAAMLKQGAAMAEAARRIAKGIGLGLEIQNEAAGYKIEAERALGALIPRVCPRGQPRKERSHAVTLKLDDLGIGRTLPAAAVQKYKTECVEAQREITSAALISVANKMKKEEAVYKRRKEKEAFHAELPSPGVLRTIEEGAGHYRVIYADPPWNYNDKGTHGSAHPHYDTMTLEALCALKVATLAHESGCFLWMWTTWPMIREKAPHAVLEAWGFRWAGEIVWNKVAFGVGRWFRLQTEILVLGVRGDVKLLENDQRGYLEKRRSRHSVKPEEARAIIERLCEGPYIELFARRSAKGWDRWGDEA